MAIEAGSDITKATPFHSPGIRDTLLHQDRVHSDQASNTGNAGG